MQAPDYSSALGLVSRGLGISVLPRLATHDLPEEVVVVPIIDPEPIRSVYALCSTNRGEGSVAELALNLVKKVSGNRSIQ